MNSDERHELKENDLKSWMQYRFPVWIKQNGSYLLLGAALLLLAYQLWGWYEKKQVAQAQSAWNELYLTDAPGVENRPVKLQAIIDQYDIKPIRAMALRALGNAYLETVATGQADEAATAITVDKDDALHRAEAAYERVIKEFPDQTLAFGASKLGLAVVAEDRLDWDAAKAQYEAIASDTGPFAGTAVALDAKAKLVDFDKRKNAPRLASLLATPATSTAPATTVPEFPTSAPFRIEPSTRPATLGAPVPTTTRPSP